ncbi:unnamed protein product [Oncorhynchus mykiss]|uniref:TGF-beta propeptide domain-containing protein n=1 Tax=Oncorhynchus mykiss TaxID=8022 RepID=A0A060WXF1_ONCMY|nr:unnamed protein product [Oncorhynchus mykiss]
MTMYRRWWISLLCVYGLMCIVHSSNHIPRNGDALSQAKAVRDASRFAGKEDTVPLRLLYSMHNHSQITHDVISTRTRASSSPTQGNHVAQASFQVDAFGEQFILDVELNQ